MKNTSLFIILSFVFLISFFVLDFYISEKIFCSYCDYDDKNLLYKLFYQNSSNSGYHSEPTIFNFIALFALSFSLSWLISKKRK